MPTAIQDAASSVSVLVRLNQIRSPMITAKAASSGLRPAPASSVLPRILSTPRPAAPRTDPVMSWRKGIRTRESTRNSAARVIVSIRSTRSSPTERAAALNQNESRDTPNTPNRAPSASVLAIEIRAETTSTTANSTPSPSSRSLTRRMKVLSGGIRKIVRTACAVVESQPSTVASRPISATTPDQPKTWALARSLGLITPSAPISPGTDWLMKE